MDSMRLVDYRPPRVIGDRKAAVIRDAVNTWTEGMGLSAEQRRACVAQALTQHHNGMSAAAAIAAGKARAGKLDRRNRSQPA